MIEFDIARSIILRNCTFTRDLCDMYWRRSNGSGFTKTQVISIPSEKSDLKADLTREARQLISPEPPNRWSQRFGAFSPVVVKRASLAGLMKDYFEQRRRRPRALSDRMLATRRPIRLMPHCKGDGQSDAPFDAV